MAFDLKQAVLNKVKQTAQSLFGNNFANDNEGWIRQGRFTPLKQIGETKLPSGITLQQLPKAYLESFSKNETAPEKLMSIGTSNFIKTASFGLIQPKAPEAVTPLEKGIGAIGTISGFVSPANPFMKGMTKVGTGTEAITRKLMMNNAPKLAGSLTAKVAPAVTAELAQAGAYAGGSVIGKLLGLNDNEVTSQSIAKDFGTGLLFRGAGNIIPKVMGFRESFHPEDKTWLDAANDTLRDKKSTPIQIKNAKDIIFNLSEHYLDQTSRINSGDNAKRLANLLIKKAGSGVGGGMEPNMGIVDKNQSTKGVGGKEVKHVASAENIKKEYDIAKKEFVMLTGEEPRNIRDLTTFKVTKKIPYGYGPNPKTWWMNKQEISPSEGVGTKLKINGEVYNPRAVLPETKIINEGRQAKLAMKLAKKQKGLLNVQVSNDLGTELKPMVVRPNGEIDAPELIKLSSGRQGETLSLPQGELPRIVVKTKDQLKRVLQLNPNANVRLELPQAKGVQTPMLDIPDPEDVAATLKTKVDKFIENALGYVPATPKGGNKGANLYTRTLRKGQEAITRTVEAGLSSENSIVRNTAQTLQNFFRGLGMSSERAVASSELKGGISQAQTRAYDVMSSIYESLGNDKKSLERINAVLDPEISKLKLSFGDLTKTEQKVYSIIREGLDLVHDTSYANGFIPKELYAANKGKYVPRMFSDFEMPEEVKSMLQSKKIDLKPYMKRGEVTDWKIENSLNDPAYALGKRLAQVEINQSVKKYTDFLASNPTYISDVARAGFTKLSDSKAYGQLAGKYVLNSAAEDLKGFFFQNERLNQVYDLFKAYDKLGIRQLQKKLLTVFNPTTNVGNIISDNIFGIMAGVDPLTLNKNILAMKKDKQTFKQLADYLMGQNIIGTDITRGDFVNRMGQIDDLAMGKKLGKIKTVANKISEFYGGTDDVYKVAAFKSMLDKGLTLEEATRRTADAFQNYTNVGKFYDVWSKTPIVGSAFVKFQGDLLRIIKNAAINSPLQLMGFLGTLKLVSDLSSKASGETPEDKATREQRAFAPIIPGLNIPLTWQTPWGEINVARYISPYFANNLEASTEGTGLIKKSLPFMPEIVKDTSGNVDIAKSIAKTANDPLLAPLAQLAVNKDFRGKGITDPNENKYSPSTLTPGEKTANQADFLFRSYLPPVFNTGLDVKDAVMGQPDRFGKMRNVPQAVARAAGIKIEQFGPEQAQVERANQQKYAIKDYEALMGLQKSIRKELYNGKITPEQAQARIDNIQSQIKMPTVQTGGKSLIMPYITPSGDFKELDLGKVMSMPESNAYETELKNIAKFKIFDDIQNLSPEDQKTAQDALGITQSEFDYYNVARQPESARNAYVMSQLEQIAQTGDRTQMLRLLASGRTELGGKSIVTSAILTDLYEQGIITYAEKKALTDLTTVNGKLQMKKSSSGKKKVSIPAKVKRPTFGKSIPFKFKTSSPSKLKLRSSSSNLVAKVKAITGK